MCQHFDVALTDYAEEFPINPSHLQNLIIQDLKTKELTKLT